MTRKIVNAQRMSCREQAVSLCVPHHSQGRTACLGGGIWEAIYKDGQIDLIEGIFIDITQRMEAHGSLSRPKSTLKLPPRQV
jgi:hypothetical protein